MFPAAVCSGSLLEPVCGAHLARGLAAGRTIRSHIPTRESTNTWVSGSSGGKEREREIASWKPWATWFKSTWPIQGIGESTVGVQIPSQKAREPEQENISLFPCDYIILAWE